MLLADLQTVLKKAAKNSRQANWLLNRRRGCEKSGSQNFPSPRKGRSSRRNGRLIPSLSNRLCLSHSHSSSQDCHNPSPFLVLCNFYLGQKLLSCLVSPAVCTIHPGCHHRAWRRHTLCCSWTREEEEVIRKVCGLPRGRRQI